MSIYHLLIRILMQTMIIVKQKVNLNQFLKILVLILSLILVVIIASLIVIKMMKKQEEECFSNQKNSEQLELKTLDWWANSVIYQVYLRSFKDSDGDGIGDLKGLSSKLDYFVDTGVDVIWLSPIFTSPLVDMGYDVSNFYDIHYEYGTMADFEDLMRKAHRLGIKVLLDYVPNHASTESQYFKLSENRTPGYENFFVWGNPRPDGENGTKEPSNWISQFGGSIWEWNETRQQYYLHKFAVSQADFNFREPAVRKELINILKFWLTKGVDGFRLDALPHLFETRADDNGLFPDEPLYLIDNTKNIHTEDLGEVYDVVYEWREFVDGWQKENGVGTKLLIAETYTNITNTMLYYGDEKNHNGAHFPFNFDFLMDLSNKSNARDFVYVANHWLIYMPHGRVANWVLGNHDNSRMATRYGPNMVDGLNALTMMLPGVACSYQGDEIGMEDGYVPWEATIDIEGLRHGRKDYDKYSRDPVRIPFYWDNTTSAGFSNNSRTWLPVSQKYKKNNLEAQKQAERSHYKVYQALTKLRKEPALSHGHHQIKALTANTLILLRYLHSYEIYSLVFNVGKEDDEVDLTREPLLKETLVVYTSSVHSRKRKGEIIPLGKIALVPGEALILS